MAQFNLTIALEYDIITAPDFDQLVTRVNERIQSGEGWQPLGGVAISRDNEDWSGMGFYQAMVRGKPKEEMSLDLALAHAMVKR